MSWLRLLRATAIAGLALPAAAAGQEPEAWEEPASPLWCVEIHAPVLSQYVFRGVVLNDEAVFQPDAFLYRTWGDGSWLGAGACLSQELTNYSGSAGEITEVDWFAEGAIPAAGGTATLGVSVYTAPDGDFDSTSEAYLAWEREAASFTGRAEITYDFMEGDGFYGRLSGWRLFELRESLAILFECGLGAMDKDYAALNVGVAAAGLADLGARGTLAWLCTENSEIALSLFSSFLLDGAYRDAVEDPDPVWFALAWTVAL